MEKNTKQKIFDAAVELFADRGYQSVSIQDIAKVVGIKKSAIYNHYKSKEELLELMIDYYLERMEQFYKRIRKISTHIAEGQKLEDLLEQIIFSYRPDEKHLMFCLTRIVHHEQFNYQQAGEALIGTGYRKYMEEHVHFFNRLSDTGYITGYERNQMYGELFARISLTFATQFLHPDIEPTIPVQTELYKFVIQIIAEHESNIKKNN